MKEVVKSNEKRISSFLEWVIYMIGYSLILITVSMLFKNTIQIDNNHYGVWALVASVVIYLLNQTIKPIIVKLTIPITALTLGIFIACIAALLISLMNMIMDKLIIKPVIGKEM